MIDTYVGRTQGMLRRSATALALAVVAACSRETLLEVETPDQISPGDAANPAGAQALRAAAIGNFHNFYSGTINVGANLYGGLISDELINARPGGDHIDQRAFNENTFPNLAWNNFGQAYTQLIRARKSLAQYAPAGATRSTQIGQLYALSSLSLSIAGELFCNGVPLSDADDTAPQFTTVSNAEMFTRAVAQADSALATLSTTAADLPLRNLARIAKARALVDLARFADAAAAVGAGGDGAGSAAVATSFVVNAEYSATTLVNTIYDWMVGTANFGPSEREGGNGLNFISANESQLYLVDLESGQKKLLTPKKASYSGATSTTSPPTKFRLFMPRNIASASRVVRPPTSGVPVPGAKAGSIESTSKER